MRNKLNYFLEWTVVVLLSIMLLSVLWGVTTRYILANQSSWTDELARFSLIWVSVLGAAYISGKNAHIAIDLLPGYLSEKNNLRLRIFIGTIVSLFVLAVFIIGGLRYIYISFKLGQTSAALELPMGYVYLIVPIAGLIILAFKTTDAVKAYNELSLLK